jgi:hypothetical protein
MANKPLLISYLLFVLLQALHTFEEIACDVFDQKMGRNMV